MEKQETALCAGRFAHIASVRDSRLIASLLLALLIFNLGCSGVSTVSTNASPTSPTSPSSSSLTITISPTSATVTAGETKQFTALINNVRSSSVNWTASAGTVSNSGAFSAPLVTSEMAVTVTVISAADSTKTAVASVTVMPRLLSTPAPPPVNSENRYCGLGNVPRFPGLFDGPAELPTSCYYTGLDGTPSPGKIWIGTDPNTLYAAASCGDVILLTAGASIAENPNFPHKNCDDQHYITIRTSTPDAQLPAEGIRISPCYFGVASLPGRPAFPQCPPGGAANLGFKIIPSLSATPVFGDHIRFIGIEFAKPPGRTWYGLDLTGSDHIIFDRVWIHSNPREDAPHGIMLRDTRYVAVINSYLNEFHCNSWPLGTCTDAHPIGGGNNTQAGTYHGTFKIYGNFLEGSGQSIIFGGGNSVDTSLDIDIEGNLLFKPLTWDPADPSYDGGVNGHPYIVKNHFELKNAGRVLFRGNRLMNVWAGFTQKGSSILLFAISQGGLCPQTCQVHDVTVAYNYITNAEQALLVVNGDASRGWFAYEGKNYSIHDLIADGLDFPTAYAPGAAPFKVELGTNPRAPSHDYLANVSINHITLVEQGTNLGGFLTVTGPIPAAQAGINWKNSVLPAGRYGVFSTGGSGNCANAPEATPLEKLNACWAAPYVFTNNLILGGDAIAHPSWPAGNLAFVTSQASTYQSFNRGFLGDYHLSPSSPGKNAADDGTDLGANIDAVMQEIAGIQ
jgi:hypothetical protein